MNVEITHAEKIDRIAGPKRNIRYRPPATKACACGMKIQEEQTVCLLCMSGVTREKPPEQEPPLERSMT